MVIVVVAASPAKINTLSTAVDKLEKDLKLLEETPLFSGLRSNHAGNSGSSGDKVSVHLTYYLAFVADISIQRTSAMTVDEDGYNYFNVRINFKARGMDHSSTIDGILRVNRETGEVENADGRSMTEWIREENADNAAAQQVTIKVQIMAPGAPAGSRARISFTHPKC